MLIIDTPQMFQHGATTGRDRTKQAYGTTGVFPNAELPALNTVDAINEGLDLLGQFLGAGDKWAQRMKANWEIIPHYYFLLTSS